MSELLVAPLREIAQEMRAATQDRTMGEAMRAALSGWAERIDVLAVLAAPAPEPFMKYTAGQDELCAVCAKPIQAGSQCYKFGTWNGDERHLWRHLTCAEPTKPAPPTSGLSSAVAKLIIEGKAPPTSGEPPERCAVCDWPLAGNADNGCITGNCSMRPLPRRPYDAERAIREYGKHAPAHWKAEPTPPAPLVDLAASPAPEGEEHGSDPGTGADRARATASCPAVAMADQVEEVIAANPALAHLKPIVTDLLNRMKAGHGIEQPAPDGDQALIAEMRRAADYRTRFDKLCAWCGSTTQQPHARGCLSRIINGWADRLARQAPPTKEQP